MLLLMLCEGRGEGGARETVLDVCTCPVNDGVWVCPLQCGGKRIRSTGCGSLRTTGSGFVMAMEPGSSDAFELVILERVTITCTDSVGQPGTTMIIDGLHADQTTVRFEP